MKTSIFGGNKKGEQENPQEFESLREQLTQQIKDISAEKAAIVRESQVLKEQLAKSEDQVREAHEKAAMYEEMVRQYEAEKRYSDESHDDMERLKNIEMAYEASEREKNGLSEELLSTRELLSEAKKQVREHEERIQILEEERADWQGSDSTQKIQALEKELRNKEILLNHYQDAEKDNIILTQDLNKARNLIQALKKSVSQLMEQMESQQKGIQYFAESITKQQDSLRQKLQEMTELQLKNVELQDSLSNMTDLYETVKKKNEALLHENEALKQSVKQGFTTTTIITPEKFDRSGPEGTTENGPGDALSKCESAYENARNLLSGLLEEDDFDEPYGMMS